MPIPPCMSVLRYQINQDALIVYSLWVRVFIVCMLKSWVSYLSLRSMATGPVCTLDRSIEKHIIPEEREWFMQPLSGAQKWRDTNLGHPSVMQSCSHFLFLWNICLPGQVQTAGLAFLEPCAKQATDLRALGRTCHQQMLSTATIHPLNQWELWVLYTWFQWCPSLHVWSSFNSCQGLKRY